MSAVPGGIGPVSVRYAAQIKDLLQTQAIDRMVAEQEAARLAAEAEKAARVEPVEDTASVKVDVETPEKQAAPVPLFRPAPESTEHPVAQLIDLQA